MERRLGADPGPSARGGQEADAPPAAPPLELCAGGGASGTAKPHARAGWRLFFSPLIFCAGEKPSDDVYWRQEAKLAGLVLGKEVQRVNSALIVMIVTTIITIRNNNNNDIIT